VISEARGYVLCFGHEVPPPALRELVGPCQGETYSPELETQFFLFSINAMINSNELSVFVIVLKYPLLELNRIFIRPICS
jgi:hypothetical protein